MPGIDFRAVKAALKGRELLRLIGFRALEWKGPECRGPCPLHQPRGQRWWRCCCVNVERYVYRCFDCDARGDLLQLYAKVVRLPLFEAVELLCREAGMAAPAAR